MLKVSLVVIVMSQGFDNGSRFAPTIDVTQMTMIQCQGVKKHLEKIFETEYSNWKTSVDCVTN